MAIVIATFTSCGQALRALDELEAIGVAEAQLSVLVSRGINRLTSADGESASVAGAALAALLAASNCCLAEVEALGAGPLIDALAGLDSSLVARLIELGFDVGVAESIGARVCDGDIVLGVDSSDDRLRRAAAQTLARIGARVDVERQSTSIA